MALIVEDGSVVANANSYVSLADAQTIADNLGYIVTLTEANLLRSMAVLNTLNYNGTRTSATTQSLPFPRSGILLSDSRILGEDEIPQELIDAQVLLAIEINSGNDPTAAAAPAKISTKVDVIEVTYKESTVKAKKSIMDFPLVIASLSYLVASFYPVGNALRIDRA